MEHPRPVESPQWFLVQHLWMPSVGVEPCLFEVISSKEFGEPEEPGFELSLWGTAQGARYTVQGKKKPKKTYLLLTLDALKLFWGQSRYSGQNLVQFPIHR